MKKSANVCFSNEEMHFYPVKYFTKGFIHRARISKENHVFLAAVANPLRPLPPVNYDRESHSQIQSEKQ